MTIAELERMMPAIDWPTYLRGLGVQSPTRVMPAMPSAIKALQRELVAASASTRQAYLTWAALSQYADALGPDIEREYDEYQRLLRGQRAPQTRADLCVDATLGAFPQEIDRRWIEWRYSALSGRKAGAMLAAIRDSMEVRLNAAGWLDEPTRDEALRKLAAIGVKLGHPETWPDEPALAIGEHYVDNLLSASRRVAAGNYSRVGRPVDPTAWEVEAVSVGAYYHGGSNTMLFPAGILQPPYFDATWPNSLNFGGVGVAMGHKLTHAFDSKGSRRDASAQARNWWSAATADAFTGKTRCIEAHLSTYEAAPGVPMEASRVLDEAIADIGGLKITHRAYRQLAAKHGEDPSARFSQHLTHDQLYFVAFAQNSCVKQTPAFEQARARTDVHAPGRVRVNSTLAQTPAFWSAFTCEPGEPLHAKVECDLW